MILPLPKLEKRLQTRFEQVAKEHIRPTQITAAGLPALPGERSAFTSTQAAWRFLANPKTSLPKLGGPLLECGRQMLATTSSRSECGRQMLALSDREDVVDSVQSYS